MRIAMRLGLAAALLATTVVMAAPAEADTVEGVMVSPTAVSPGDPVTVSGPVVAGDCNFGFVIVRDGSGPEYKLGPRTSMQIPWSITATEFTLEPDRVAFVVGTYTVGIECFNDRGFQTIFETTATFTVVPLPPPDPSSYQPLTPGRLLDTRPGQTTVDGQAAGGGPVGAGLVQDLKVTGRGGVPESNVKAVALNITATDPSAAGFLTAYPTGEARPLASNVNFAAGQTVPNLVVAKVGAGGQVSIFNATGSTNLIADVTGWFPAASSFTPLTPARLLDTRPGQTTVDGVNAGAGPPGPGGLRTIRVTGRGGVTAAGVAAVILNVTAVAPTTAGFVTVYPAGDPRPLASNVNFRAGQTVANSVVAKVGADGSVNLYNDTGSTQLIADVAGWFPTDSSYHSLSPARLTDTRPGQATIDNQEAGFGAVPGGDLRRVKVLGRAGVPPARVSAVVLNITATDSTTGGFVTVFPTREPRPLASSLNFTPGQTTANLVIAKVGAFGEVSIFNATGSVHIVVDVAGWFAR